MPAASALDLTALSQPQLTITYPLALHRSLDALGRRARRAGGCDDSLMAALVGPNKATCSDATTRKCDFLIMELVARLPSAARSFRRRDSAD